ncbi:hypothetical protein IL54_4480 [Sphingobium sp. ba1]|uniref:Uncharacterized protein n=1 Tax=Novosphingobium pentaromativorans US6-1 TaxID=1088721 RepID=G6EJL5_9SPHN|nr:hypothetical protein NSU_4536 [Novosphingobium pentaromativorans US6-1]KFL49175.1 hypothetical protein IL54_4480 [Sphingobium sp. ba1]
MSGSFFRQATHWNAPVLLAGHAHAKLPQPQSSKASALLN